MKIEIIEATESHIPDITELWVEFMDYHKDIDQLFTRDKNGHVAFRTNVLDWIQSKDALVLVALDNKQVVGFSMSEVRKYPPIYDRDSCGSIENMAVKSGHRRRGIGEQMLAKILEWFTSRDIDRIEIAVSTRNQAGYSFWRKHGFQDYVNRLFLDRK